MSSFATKMITWCIAHKMAAGNGASSRSRHIIPQIVGYIDELLQALEAERSSLKTSLTYIKVHENIFFFHCSNCRQDSCQRQLILPQPCLNTSRHCTQWGITFQISKQTVNTSTRKQQQEQEKEERSVGVQVCSQEVKFASRTKWPGSPSPGK